MRTGASQGMSIADLFESSREQLFRYGLSLSKTVDRADDLVQETFLRAMANAEKLEHMNEYQRDAWLKRVLRNRFFDEQRKQRRASAAALEGIRHARRSAGELSLIDLDLLLDRVPGQFRETVEKRYRFGMNSSEIGTQLGIPPATVRSHLRLAINQLRREMEQSRSERRYP